VLKTAPLTAASLSGAAATYLSVPWTAVSTVAWAPTVLSGIVWSVPIPAPGASPACHPG